MVVGLHVIGWLRHSRVSLRGAVHSWIWLMTIRAGLVRKTWPTAGGSRCFSERHLRASPAKKLLLAAHAVLVSLKSLRTGLDQGVFDGPHDIRRKYRSSVDGSGHRLFPCLQHLIHLAPGSVVNQCIGIHEDLVQLPAEEEGIWCSNILDDGIKNV